MAIANLETNTTSYDPGSGAKISLRPGNSNTALTFDQMDDNFHLLATKINEALGDATSPANGSLNKHEDLLTNATTGVIGRVGALEASLSSLTGSNTWGSALTVSGDFSASNLTAGSVTITNDTSSGYDAILSTADQFTIGTSLQPSAIQIDQSSGLNVLLTSNAYANKVFAAGKDFTGLSTNTTASHLLETVQGAESGGKYNSTLQVNGAMLINGNLTTTSQLWAATDKFKVTAIGAVTLVPLSGPVGNYIWKDTNGYLRMGSTDADYVTTGPSAP